MIWSVWSYNTCWKLCLKLGEFSIQSCRSVLCDVCHPFSKVHNTCAMIASSFSCSIRVERNQFIQLFGSASKGLQYLLIVSPSRYGWSVNVALQTVSYFLISASYVPIWKTCHTWVKTYSLARTRTFRTFAYSASAYRLDHRLHHLFPEARMHTWCNAWFWRQLIIRSTRIRVCFVWITADIDQGLLRLDNCRHRFWRQLIIWSTRTMLFRVCFVWEELSPGVRMSWSSSTHSIIRNQTSGRNMI